MNLTEDNVTLIRYVCKGMDNGAIATALSIEPEAAKSRVRRVMAKLGVGTRAELAERGAVICGRIPRLDLSCLNQAEHDVTRLVAEGKSNYAISRVLGCSEDKVKRYLQAIFRKLGIEKRAQLAAAYALAA